MTVIGNEVQNHEDSDRVWWMRFAIISGLVLAVCAVLAYPSAAFVYPHLMGASIKIMMSPSMGDSYKPGDLVVVKPVDPSDVKVNDVVSYETDAHIIVHRVIEKRNQGQTFIFKGDNSAAPDMPVKATQIRAKVIHKMPLLGLDNGKIVYKLPFIG